MTDGVDDYPWRTAQPDSTGDGFGYLLRECTSFGAWRARQHGFSPPFWGNADSWPDKARAARLTVDSTPSIGAIAILPSGIDGAGRFGHVSWVLAVLQGAIRVEDYNWGDQWTYNQHDELTAGVVFIHLPGPQPVVTTQPTGGTAESNVEDDMSEQVESFERPDGSFDRYNLDPKTGIVRHVHEGPGNVGQYADEEIPGRYAAIESVGLNAGRVFFHGLSVDETTGNSVLYATENALDGSTHGWTQPVVLSSQAP